MKIKYEHHSKRLPRLISTRFSHIVEFFVLILAGVPQ